ncbi:hypothetical protein HYX13_04155 [Candidatus Woesearchaeota archaeon]|nr:hypothetical protein [Candidatus Woesearchaeota archaeon]
MTKPNYRILTHSNCLDGFCSAFIVKKYFNVILGTTLSQEEIQKIPVIGVEPQELQEKEVTAYDLVVDLPLPIENVFFWCDHHITSKPKNTLPKNYHWKDEPSCTGYLLALAEERGLTMSDELKAFKKAIDIKDAALYTVEHIKECFYPQKNYELASPLLKLHMIDGMFSTRDKVLNDEIFRTLLSRELGETPLSTQTLWQLDPLLFHRAHLESYAQWRENVDTYLVYNEEIKTVVQDDRKAEKRRGVADRFYVYLKFPQASYSVNFGVIEEENKTRFGLGSNPFHKDRCKVNLGELCKEIGKKFGFGPGGGHHGVGGVSVKKENTDKALEFILGKLKEGK